MRAANVINDDVIIAIEEFDRIERVNGNSRLVDAYMGEIRELEKEKIHASSICGAMFNNLADDSLN